jgi:choline kinase
MEVIILAAGKGSRLNSNIPKCLYPLGERSVILRITEQVKRYIPKAKIKIIVGYKYKTIKNHTSMCGVSYVYNNKFNADKNIWSVILGVKESKEGVLIMEGDCVYEDSAFKEIASSLGSDSTIFLNGRANKDGLNGIVKVKNNNFDDFIIGEKSSLTGSHYFNMAGALWISKNDLKKFLREALFLAKESLNSYYFEPIFNKQNFTLKCKILSGKVYTFNTKPEYEFVLKKINFIEYFDTSKLKHIESFSPRKVVSLKKKIIKENTWTKPICIDPSGLVMDGQHRMEVSKELGLNKIPAIIFDYKGVEIFSLRKNYSVSVKSIKERVKKDNIYPYKTVKHKFPIEIPLCQIPLNLLYEY